MEKPSYYCIITADVRYNNNLTDSEKLLYGEITALSNKNGYCTALNRYFGELYGCVRETISRRISHLKNEGLIDVELIKDGEKIVERRIHPIDANINRVLTEESTPSPQNNHTPIDAKVKGNNTSKNITRESAREKELNHPLQKFVKDELPEVSKLDKQLTANNCKKLISDFSKELIRNVLYAMENHNGLTKKYKSVNLTVRNWCKARLENNPELNQNDQPVQQIV